MDNAPLTSEQTPPAHKVTMEGCYGTMVWTVDHTLYSALPRADRDQLLDKAGCDLVSPHLVDLTGRLLRQAGCGTEATRLDSTYSLENRDDACPCFGAFVWMISQGLWDAIPEDQRDTLLELAHADIHEFLRDRIVMPLQRYAVRSFRQG